MGHRRGSLTDTLSAMDFEASDLASVGPLKHPDPPESEESGHPVGVTGGKGHGPSPKKGKSRRAPKKVAHKPEGLVEPKERVPTISPGQAAIVATAEKANSKLEARRKRRAEMAKAAKGDAPSAKNFPKKPVNEWGQSDVNQWLSTLVSRESVHQWATVVADQQINGPKLLGLKLSDLVHFTAAYATITEEREIIAEGIRRLNFEGARAGKRTLRRAVRDKTALKM